MKHLSLFTYMLGLIDGIDPLVFLYLIKMFSMLQFQHIWLLSNAMAKVVPFNLPMFIVCLEL